MPRFSRQEILLTTLVILALLFAYIQFYPETAEQSITVMPEASEAEQQFISLSSQLDAITIDTKILSDPRFLELVDIATPVLPEDAGRTDPFFPFAVSAPVAP
jgi:hypothetical protein